MNPYHKIKNVFKRTDDGRLILGRWTEPWMEALAECPFVWTEKIDGTNIRVMLKEGHVSLGGRTNNAQIPVKLVQRLIYLFPEDKMIEIFSNTAEVCLYGEGYGAGIQKGGGNYRADQDFILFDIKINGIWLDRCDVMGLGERLGISVVPTIGVFKFEHAYPLVDVGFPSNVAMGDIVAEGLVGKPPVELMDKNGERLIVKIKHKDFARAKHPEPINK